VGVSALALLPADARRVGVWEDGRFVGAVIFSRGANNNIGSPFGLPQTEVVELTRVALAQHRAPVSRIVAVAVRLLKRQSPGLRLLVSYADPGQGHVGTIYQAMNWIYVGRSKPQRDVLGATGREVHKRTASARRSSCAGLAYGPKRWKHKYVLVLDRGLVPALEGMRRPYPRATEEAPCR